MTQRVFSTRVRSHDRIDETRVGVFFQSHSLVVRRVVRPPRHAVVRRDFHARCARATVLALARVSRALHSPRPRAFASKSFPNVHTRATPPRIPKRIENIPFPSSSSSSIVVVVVACVSFLFVVFLGHSTRRAHRHLVGRSLVRSVGHSFGRSVMHSTVARSFLSFARRSRAR